jgi:predicted RNA-binding Zn-ribbon protein involved in translation (DUF1610 family)
VDDEVAGGEAAERDLDDRHCPSCGTLMKPVGLPSGEIISRCPKCRQIAI